jgi:hypothetical protein
MESREQKLGQDKQDWQDIALKGGAYFTRTRRVQVENHYSFLKEPRNRHTADLFAGGGVPVNTGRIQVNSEQ